MENQYNLVTHKPTLTIQILHTDIQKENELVSQSKTHILQS